MEKEDKQKAAHDSLNIAFDIISGNMDGTHNLDFEGRNWKVQGSSSDDEGDYDE